MMSFLCDMGISSVFCQWLREQEYDATHISEEGNFALPDREILQKAKEENRVLLTVDLDFANLVSEWGSDTLPPTVVIFRLPVVRASALIGSFPQLCFVLGNIPDDKAAIISVTKERIRLRNLPI